MTEAENPERKTGAIKKAVEAMVAAIKNEQPEKQHKQPSSAKKAEVKPRQTIPLEKVVTTTENGVKKHEWTTIKSKPIDEVKKHISSARGKGGVLREIVPSVLPQDEQLLQLLDEVAYMREKGASPMDAYQFYQHNRGAVLGAEGEQEIYSRMWLTGREMPITPDTIREAAIEGVGSPRRTSTTTGAISGETAYTDLLNGLDTKIDDLPTEFKGRIARLQDLISGPNAGIREGDMDLAIRDLDNLRGRSKAAFTADNDWTIAEIKRRFMERKAVIQAAIEREEYIPNRMYINPEIAIRELNDPIGTTDFITDEALVQIFKGAGQSPAAKQAMEVLEQLQYVLFDPSFVEKRLDMFHPDKKTAFSEAEKKAVLKLRNKFQELSKPQKERFARSFNIRFKAAQYWEKWKDASSLNEKDFQLYINSRLDEDDFFGLDAQYGALVGRFRRSLAKNYSKCIFDEQGQRRGMDPHWWDDAVKETIKEMQDSKRNLKRYEQYRNGEFFKIRPGSKKEEATLRPHKPSSAIELKKDYEEACRAIGDLAKVRMMMSFEKFNIDARFAPPKWSQSQKDIASDFLEKQRVVRLSHPYENHLMQWNTLGTGKTELERANIRHRAQIWLESMPEARHYGDNWAEELWERVEAWKTGALPKEQERILFGQIDCLFYFQPDPLRRPPDPSGGGYGEMGSWIKNLSKNRLQKEAQIYTGMQLSQRFDINPYFVMFESGYRRGSETTFLSSALTIMDEVKGVIEGVVGPRQLNGVFDAGTVVGATLSYKDALTSGNAHGAKESYLGKLASVARTRPHDLIMALKEGHSRSLPGVEAALVGNREGGLVKAYGDLATSFEEIRDELLERKFHTQVDYFIGVDGLDEPQKSQKNVATEWFKERYGADAEQQMQWYFETMQRMSHYLLGEAPVSTAAHSHIQSPKDKLRYILIGNLGTHGKSLSYGALQEFANPGYIPSLSKARWDDFPYEWLQEPERILGMIDPEGKVLSENALSRISDRFIGEHSGDEQSGPYRRQMRDAGGAQDAFELEAGTMVPDEKIHVEAIQKKYLKIGGYQGAEAAALSTDVGSGARIRTQLVLPTHGPFFEKMRGACEMSKYGFPKVKAISADEAHTSLLTDREATFGVGMNVPSDEKILETVEAHAGISNWDRVFRVIDYIPVLGQAKRAAEVAVGHKRWGRLKEQLNNRFATGIIAHKGLMSLPYIGFVLGVYIITELSRAGDGEKKSH